MVTNRAELVVAVLKLSLHPVNASISLRVFVMSTFAPSSLNYIDSLMKQLCLSHLSKHMVQQFGITSVCEPRVCCNALVQNHLRKVCFKINGCKNVCFELRKSFSKILAVFIWRVPSLFFTVPSSSDSQSCTAGTSPSTCTIMSLGSGAEHNVSAVGVYVSGSQSGSGPAEVFCTSKLDNMMLKLCYSLLLSHFNDFCVHCFLNRNVFWAGGLAGDQFYPQKCLVKKTRYIFLDEIHF